MELGTVWFASEQRIRSRSKLVVFDDVGRLSVEGDSLAFSGGKLQFLLRCERTPALVSQTLNSVTYVWALLLLAPILALEYLMFASLGRGTDFLPVLALVPVAVIAGVLVGRSTKWVEVRGRDSQGNSITCYFADAGLMGWSGILGGTKRLMTSMRSCLTSASS